MTEKELNELVRDISYNYFEASGLVKSSFEHKAAWNSRLSSTGGRFLTKTCNLEFNPKQLDVHGLGELISIIKHELVHYHLYRQGLPFKHGKEFKALLAEVGGKRYCQPVGAKKQWKTMYLYACRLCGREYRRKRPVDTKRYICGVKGCGGRLVKQT